MASEFDFIEELLDEFGFSVSVSRDYENDSNPATGVVTASTPLTYTGFGYPSRYKQNMIDGEMIKHTDTRFIFQSTTKPENNDIFTFGGKVLTVEDVQDITSSGDSVVYIVQLRQ